jgi:hypothetical protein
MVVLLIVSVKTMDSHPSGRAAAELARTYPHRLERPTQGIVDHLRKIASLTTPAVSSTFFQHFCMHSEKSAISL